MGKKKEGGFFLEVMRYFTVNYTVKTQTCTVAVVVVVTVVIVVT